MEGAVVLVTIKYDLSNNEGKVKQLHFVGTLGTDSMHPRALYRFQGRIDSGFLSNLLGHAKEIERFENGTSARLQ